MTLEKLSRQSVEARLLRAEASLAALSRGEVDILIGVKEPLLVRFKSLVEEKERQGRLLDTLLEGAPTLIVQVDSQGRIMRFNAACERLTGRSRDEVVGRSMTQLFPALGWGHIVANVVAAKLGNKVHPSVAVPYVSHWITSEGEKLLIEWRCTALVAPDNDGHFILAFGLDITERERSQEIAAEARRYSESIIATVREPLLVLDGNLRVESANPSFYKTFEVVPAETLGRQFQELGNQQWKIPALGNLLETILPQNNTFDNFEVEHSFPNIGRRIFLLNARRVHRNTSKNARILLAMEDVTEKRAAEESARQQARILQSVVDSMGDGLAVADEKGKFLLFNPAAEQILGVGPVDEGPDAWTARYSLYLPDGVTPCPAAEIPLARAIRGEAVDQVELFIKNQRNPSGICISVTGRPLSDDHGELRGGTVVFRDITERKQMEQELRRISEHLTRVTAASPAILYTIKVEGDSLVPTWVSDNAVLILGFTMEEMLKPGWWVQNLHPDDRAAAIAQAATTEHGALVPQEYRFLRKDGSIVWIRGEMRVERDPAGKPRQIIGAWLDITEKKGLEGQLHQSQKMEAFGQLAVGVAHDFNSLLTIITGYSDMLLHGSIAPEKQRYFIREIRAASDKAAGLTRQLLAFSRKQMLQPVDLNLNTLVAETEKMLSRLIGEDIDLATELDPALGQVRADPSQIEQVIMNLAVNARDAMPTGGHLTIETRNVELDDNYVKKHPEAQAGTHVMLAVTDSGCGMDEATRVRVFEPFFTTKEVGKGTGLGLATVHGIVKQSNGCIEVYSEPGLGSTFKIYLPRLKETAESVRSLANETLMPVGTETILFAEDEEGVRGFVRLALESLGYTVLAARNGAEAEHICQQHSGPIHLLLTDVVMPKMSGRQLADQVAGQRPQIKVLYLSGYTDDAVVRHGVLQSGVAFLQKPLTSMVLAKKVREVLDAGKSG
jgi:PAS domain S-box-containing protein